MPRALLSRLLLIATTGLAVASCSTPKEASSDLLGPEATIHSIPEGADVQLAGKSLGKAPVSLPVHRADKALTLTFTRDQYFPTTATIDAAPLYSAGGGEMWIPLKPVSMGDATGPLAPDSAADVDRAGVSTGKAGRCDDAIQFFNRAQAMDPHLVRVFKDRAHCLFKLHRREDALNELDKYLLAAPDAPDAAKVAAEVSKGRGGREFDTALPEVPSP